MLVLASPLPGLCVHVTPCISWPRPWALGPGPLPGPVPAWALPRQRLPGPVPAWAQALGPGPDPEPRGRLVQLLVAVLGSPSLVQDE